MNLAEIIQVFNTSLNEEQIWAVCYQYVKRFIANRTAEGYSKGYAIATDLESVCVSKDGEISVVEERLESSDRMLIDAFGRVLFEASDYRTDLNDENAIGPDLERLIERMTVAYDGILSEEDDEGYEDYEEEHHSLDHGPCTWEIVKKLCEEHLDKPSKANEHYLAVCRALITEAVDLKSFLEKVSTAGESLESVANLNNNNDTVDGNKEDFPALNFTEWAHLWIQVVSDLRVGVKLKKLDGCARNREFELTPYEILMADIRRRNYRLKKIAVNGEAPHRISQNPHEIILEFIRSRPTLKPIKNRILGPPPPRSKSLHELLLEEIQERPVPLRHVRPPPESPLMKRIDDCHGFMTSARSYDDMLNTRRTKRKLDAPPYAAQFGVAVSTTDFDESDTESEDDSDSDSSFMLESSTPESPLNDEEPPSFKRHNRNSNPCSLRSSGTSGVSSGGADENDPSNEKNKSFHRKTSTVRQKKVLPVELPDYSASGETRYRKFSSRGGGVKRAHTFSAKSSERDSPLCAVRPTWRELRAKAAKKAAMAYEESDEVLPLPLRALAASPLRKIHEDRGWTQVQARVEDYPRGQGFLNRERVQYVSITTDELIAIRKKLVAHDLEQYQDRGQLYSLLKKGKICFNCRVREFNIFWWARNCQICEQKICSKCMRKVETPFGKNLEANVQDLKPTLATESYTYKQSYSAQQSSSSRSFGMSLSALLDRGHGQQTGTLKRPPASDSQKLRKMDVCEACQTLVVRVLTSNESQTNANHLPGGDCLKRSSSSVGGLCRPAKTLSRSSTSVGASGMQGLRAVSKYRPIET